MDLWIDSGFVEQVGWHGISWLLLEVAWPSRETWHDFGFAEELLERCHENLFSLACDVKFPDLDKDLATLRWRP